MHFSSTACALAFVGTASAAAVKRNSTSPAASPDTTPAPSATTVHDNACAKASAASASYVAANPKATSVWITPSVAEACLKSIPVDTENDLALLDYLEPYNAWQSTLEQLAAPPEGYLLPGVDILRGLGQIRAKLTQGKYASQVDFARELDALYLMAADGHLAYDPAILSVFRFRRSQPVVSVSEDGTSLPKIYLSADLEKSVAEKYKPSDIASIDGTPIVEALEYISSRYTSQDPDSQYNYLFASVPFTSNGGGNAFASVSNPTLPDTSTIKFTNGSTYTYNNRAFVISDLTGVDTAAKFHSVFELPSPSTASVAASAPSDPPTLTSSVEVGAAAGATETATAIPGYPSPVVKHPNDILAGYFIEEKGYEDTAVFAITTFEPSGDAEKTPGGDNATEVIINALKTTNEFFKAAAEAKKSKLVIDLSANPGGYVAIGYLIYSMMFPSADIWDSARLRAHDGSFAVLSTAFDVKASLLVKLLGGSVLDVNHEAYKTFDALFGPEFAGRQNATHILRSDFTGTIEQALGGKAAPNPFKAEDIVVVTDGFCASTCTVFTGLLAREQGVRTIALGGRPRALPMQAIGGVKGSQVLSLKGFQDNLAAIYGAAANASDTAVLEKFAAAIPTIGEPPLLPGIDKAGSFNYKNAYSRKDPNGYPLQFVYEAANCRLFYTYDMILDPRKTWQRSAGIAFKGEKCAAGSTVDAGGLIGVKALPFDAKVVSSVPAPDIPGSLSFKGDYLPASPKSKLQSRHDRAMLENFDWENWQPGPVRAGVL